LRILDVIVEYYQMSAAKIDIIIGMAK
jgi:hypothetical protein